MTISPADYLLFVAKMAFSRQLIGPTILSLVPLIYFLPLHIGLGVLMRNITWHRKQVNLVGTLQILSRGDHWSIV